MSPDEQKKPKFIERVAAEENVSIAICDREGRTLLSAHNNSICRKLLSSQEFAPECARFCGQAFEMAKASGGHTEYECHAGLFCRAAIVAERGAEFVAIVGRTFLKPENYKRTAERAITGDLKQFPPTEFFENVLISGSTDGIDRALKRIEGVSARNAEDLLQVANLPPIPVVVEDSSDEGPASAERTPEADVEDVVGWRSLFGSLLKMEYTLACITFLRFLSEKFALTSLAWFNVKGGAFISAAAIGELEGHRIELGIDPADERIVHAATTRTVFEMVQRRSKDPKDVIRRIGILPVTIGGEVRAAIGISSPVKAPALCERISRAAQAVAPQLEILRLSDEISQHDWLARAVKRFNESLKRIDADDFWTHVTQVSAELLQAERASLLVPAVNAEGLHARAAIGARTDLFAMPDVGSRVAIQTLLSGTPLVVSDIHQAGLTTAPSDRSYRTSSFISFPILIGERRLGVMNFTDKATGDIFGERDLELLQAIAPQIAVAIDRTDLKDKAGVFEQLSVTDVLTGLLNRRYLQERLAEELSRSKRYRYPMTLLMIDVDKFKQYNDAFGHPAGDEALKMVSGILKDNLRGADVAARYGGEEFAVLLPQTPIEEAGQIAERIRRQVERTQFPHRNVTVSIGLATCTSEIASPDDLIWAADRALYEAKDRGRNNVRVFDADSDTLVNNIH